MANIYSRFLDVVERQPNAPALRSEKRVATYAELNRLAAAVMSRFPTPHPRRVGIVMDHSVEMIAAIFGVLRSGAAYVAAEPDLPTERTRFMMNEAEVDFVITTEAYRHRFAQFKTMVLPAWLQPLSVEKMSEKMESGAIAPAHIHSDNPAYILYTSGTTGKPKGVVVSQGNVLNYADAFEKEFHIGRHDVMLQNSVCTFDIFIEEVFASLLNGASLLIAEPRVKEDAAKLLEFADDYGCTIITGFPYLALDINKAVANGTRLPRALRLLISGGDVLRAQYVDHLVDKVEVYNTYGPSETTVCATYCRCNGMRPLPDGTYPIGHAVEGVEIEVCDDRLQRVVPGMLGEICIMGDGVSKGYLTENPESANFVNRGDGRRCYCSGDLGYELPDGSLAFVRRKDRQVMIMGKRVECDEVENVLMQMPEVESSVVCPATDAHGFAFLTAYIVPRDGFKVSMQRLRKKLGKYLTSFMVPEFIVKLKRMPLTPNGKVNLAALPMVQR